ncbi:hypothetical protein [Adhaeribacter pallidiroseus]|uniref:hypothetical protein n=1 Tax=Adhaeribacter pallidiroseus TaxID=2072847 RepID=UPI0011C03CB9|nr:hypothetical protein [Adhaeribacter pallidiroseus]
MEGWFLLYVFTAFTWSREPAPYAGAILFAGFKYCLMAGLENPSACGKLKTGEEMRLLLFSSFLAPLRSAPHRNTGRPSIAKRVSLLLATAFKYLSKKN